MGVLDFTGVAFLACMGIMINVLIGSYYRYTGLHGKYLVLDIFVATTIIVPMLTVIIMSAIAVIVTMRNIIVRD